MLPDFPLLKRELLRLLEMGVIAELPGRPDMSQLLVMLPRHPDHEGDDGILVRETGDEEDIPINTYSAEDLMNLDEVNPPTLREAYESMRDLASKTHAQVTADADQLMNTTAESIGNVIKLGERPLPEDILEGVEKMLLFSIPESVDELFDLPQVQRMLDEVPTQALEEAREQMKNGAYKEQTERLLEQKREEHRVRESNRKLVG